jgi:hypothetical protein
MLKLTLPRFRRLLVDSAASSLSSARFRRLLAVLCSIPPPSARSGRGVAREGSRAAPERGEQRSASGEREGWSCGEGDEAERVESGEREEQWWRRVWDMISHVWSWRGTGTWGAWWARPAPLLTPFFFFFSFSFSFFFIIYCTDLLFYFFKIHKASSRLTL